MAALPKGPFSCPTDDCSREIDHEGPHEPMPKLSISETLSLPDEPSVEEPQVQSAAEADGSPLSVRKHMERMTADAAVLADAVRRAKTASDEALAVWRRLRDDLDETTRILRAYERIRHPQKREKA